MNKLGCLIGMFFTCGVCEAQILCIYCYNQNDSISSGVNNLLLNGGFENNNCTPFPGNGHFCPNSSSYNCDITNWICTGGGTNTYACIFDTVWSYIVEGNSAAYFGNYYCDACSITNDTSCLNNIDCTVTGISSGYPISIYSGYGGTTGVSLEQTVTGLVTGNTYALEFWTGGEFVYSERGLFAVNVGFGDTLLKDRPAEPVTGIGTRFIIEFIATSSSHTIKFTNWGHICGGCTELVLDDARLYTLAELDASVPHCTVGIDNPDFQNADYLISPNPFSNELNVKTNNNQLSEIIIYDITSRRLLQQKFTNSISINTEQLAKGIYLYEVRNKNDVVKKGKVVKD